MPRFRLTCLLGLMFLVAVACATFIQSRNWYNAYRLRDFSIAVESMPPGDSTNVGSRYKVNVADTTQFMFSLYLTVTVGNSHVSEGKEAQLVLANDEKYDDLEFKIFIDTDAKRRRFEFPNGEVVRVFWRSEGISSNRSRIVAVAVHSRNGRVVEMKFEEIEVELQPKAKNGNRLTTGVQ